ncbi:acetylcholine receptor subunit beta-like 1-like [Aplysia californica]|uniref:Acetylcholine receptor subunit beta-like 1-like n=1 Tax=Aplysia californica TaxID=6500 RepID=M4VN08_APLCA|nr:acetylcholine receptor subunit beta-like 1-like [Aplysia californica]AGI03864.1 nicotinic acetylcholine receptor subunit type J2 [Aplysia californica]
MPPGKSDMCVTRAELCVLLLITCVIYCVHGFMDERDLDERRLNHDLFHKNSYNNLIRPVVNASESLQINFSLALSAIINVDEKNQMVITNVWLQMYWFDYQLTWDPLDYGNITGLRINHSMIWIPDLVLFNNADGRFEPTYIPNCVVESSGKITFIPAAIYTSSCTIDVEYFPFDQQECEMKIGSWTFEGKTLVYQLVGNRKIVLTDYMKNGAWDIMDCPGNITTIDDAMTGQPKEIMIFTLVLRRKTLFYTVNLIIPCFLHAMACLCVFVLPADGCEKITLVISVLVSMAFLLLVLQKILPPSMTIPLIAKYFVFSFMMNVLEIVVTVITIFANHKTPRTDVMPKWVCWLFLYKLPKYLFMERPDHDTRWQQKSCTPPPSYPSTPQVPRAHILPREVMDMRLKKLKKSQPSTSRDRSGTRDYDRVNNRRHQFSTSRSHGLMASSASGSRASAEGGSPMVDYIHDLPTNGHHCMLRDSGASQSDDSMDGDVTLDFPATPPRRVNPLIMTKEVYSASNAIKFICNQMKNKEDYDTVLDDWKYMASVLDRLLMVVYVLVSLGGTLGVLVNAPHILETVDQDKVIEQIKNAVRVED